MNAEPPTSRFQMEHQSRRPGYAKRYPIQNHTWMLTMAHPQPTPLEKPLELTPVTHWDVGQHGQLTTAAIRRIHHPANRYRISHAIYIGGDAPTGQRSYGRTYVLHGRCVIESEILQLDVTAPCYFDFPQGRYKLSVPFDSDVFVVNVYPLPEKFWASNQPQNRDLPGATEIG